MLRCPFVSSVSSKEYSRRSAARSVVEKLENRQLMSAVPLTVTPVAVAGGTQLQINGTAGNDKITVTETAAGLVVTNTGWTSTFTGSYQSIVIRSGNGNDSVVVDPSVHIDTTIFGGNGNDAFHAGSGNDTLVSLGAKTASLYGGSGQDSFWMDNTAGEKTFNVRADENAYGAVHRVSSFFNASTASVRSAKQSKASKKAASIPPALPEPAVNSSGITYQNFSDHPLFSSAGPSPDDIYQGQLGDCYYLAVLSAVAKTDPMKIRQSILNMDDGTYLVEMQHNGQNVFVHVDSSLPVLWANQPAYAGFGTGGSIWAAIMEKAWTYVRGGAASYAGIDSGWMDEAFEALGASPSDIYNAASGQALLTLIQAQLAAGRAVTYATNNPVAGAPLLGEHAYTVASVVTNSYGVPTALVLRNPWGFDGAGHDSNPNDGYVTVTGSQALGSLLGVVSASV